MMNLKVGLAVCAAGLIAGCDYAGGDQVTATQDESTEAPNFGSATDISTNGNLTSNRVDRADIGIGGPEQGEAGNYRSQPLAGQSSDQELAKQIKVALTTGSTGTTGVIAADQLTKIDVQVRAGHVTLSGPVTTEAEKKSIGEQVADFKGVRSVENNLTVSPASRREDQPIDSRVPRQGEIK